MKKHEWALVDDRLEELYEYKAPVMYQSIPSLTIPPRKPRGIFERANAPSPGQKESAKPRPLRQKNRAKSPTRPGQLFFNIQQKNTKHEAEIIKKKQY